MNKRDQMNANYAVADALLGKHTGASKGNHAKPKGKISFKGTKPHKGEYAVTWKKKF